jgi:LysM repeat protein
LAAALIIPAGKAMPDGETPVGPADAQTHEHTVVKGDTLWDISGEYMREPYLWPEIWKLNPEIKNPDLIFPGDKIVLPGPAPSGGPSAAEGGLPEGMPSIEGKTVVGAAGKARTQTDKDRQELFQQEPLVDINQTLLLVPEEKKDKVLSLDTGIKPKVPVATPGEILEAGYITENLNTRMAVSGTPMGEREVYSITDKLYVFPYDGIKPGDTLISFRPDADIDHPATGRDIGTLIKVTGMLMAIREEDGFMLCEVTETLNDIRNGDVVSAYTVPEPVYEPVPKDPAMKGEWGYVVSSKDDKILNGQTFTVYLDLGRDDGVKTGDVFEVRRSGGMSIMADTAGLDVECAADRKMGLMFCPPDTRTVKTEAATAPVTMEYPLPDVVVGEVQVISAEDTTSAARVITFVEPVRPGQRAYYKD